jgi:hypothetical protein
MKFGLNTVDMSILLSLLDTVLTLIKHANSSPKNNEEQGNDAIMFV